MSDDEKMPVGYEAGMVGGAGLNGQGASDYYSDLVRRGIADPAKQAQDMPNRVGLGGEFTPNPAKIGRPLDEALVALADERESLCKAVAQLTERLKPLLRPEEVVNAHGAGGGGGAPAAPSPIVAALRAEATAFSAQRRAINRLLSRLDL